MFFLIIDSGFHFENKSRKGWKEYLEEYISKDSSSQYPCVQAMQGVCRRGKNQGQGKMSLERFLKVVDGNVVLVNIQGNLVRTYYKKGDASRVDWYDRNAESVQIQLNSGKIVIVNKNGGIVRTI